MVDPLLQPLLESVGREGRQTVTLETKAQSPSAPWEERLRTMPIGYRLFTVVLLAIVAHAPAVRAAEPGNGEIPAAIDRDSPVPVLPGLEPQVEFWKQVFATYTTRQVVIHDALHLDRIYEVLDFEPLTDGVLSDAEIAAYAQDKVRSEKERLRTILLELHQRASNPGELSPEEAKIWALFPDVDNPSRFLDAAADDRIRSQTGLRERFAAGVEVARGHLPEMEAVFRREGLPIELTRLPLVESCFNLHAYSKVGAAGIWQFMPSTARLYMQVDRALDERRDPIVSTRAAARFLRANYNVLGSWPLAITAYNHGRAGVANAVATVGSDDLMVIIREYQGPAFKFASRNFYAEFLAALDVERHASQYFGGLSPVRRPRTDSVILSDRVTIQAAARASGSDVGTLAQLNPALTRDVVAGKFPIPKGYALRIPVGSAANFQVRYASVRAEEKRAAAKPRYVVHRVKAGQTLAGIAKRHGTTVAALRRHNKLRADRVRPGQSLTIPTT
ncbi:MAG: LysM peptidoglycan-binding protein [Deltaproteobacteria bacterium]|nr:LysM peptidoglycan-binding protein [Deltaproteobacteria bacterium]